MHDKIRVAIIGAAGYTGAEALDLLLGHPNYQVVAAISNSQAQKPVVDVLPRLRGRTNLVFQASLNVDADAWILCTGHGRAAKYLEDNPPKKTIKIVDLSSDFRLEGDHEFSYGLPEAFASEIRKASRVANPGCFATAIQLALLPLAKQGLLHEPVSITAVTGSTGAGQAPSATTHFSWRADNLSVYKAYEHQHIAEIQRTLRRIQPNAALKSTPPIHFIPVRGDFARGIFSVAQLPTQLSQKQATALYEDFYVEAKNTFVASTNPDLQQVVRTNHALVYPIVKNGQIAIISMLDNLRKGASSQAIENLDLMFGF